MDRTRVISSVVILFLVLGCGEGSEDALLTVQSDSSGIAIVSNDLGRLDSVCRLSEAPRVSIGETEGEEEYQLYRVFGATMLRDGRIALVNQGSQELRFYTPDGEFLHAAGSDGDGPGEFRSAFYLWTLSDGEIWVGDYRPWQFEVFTPDGDWIRQVRPEPRYSNPPRIIAVLSDGRSLLASQDIMERSPSFELTYLTVLLHDRDGALLDTVDVLPHGRWGQTVDDGQSVWLYPWFESFTEFTAHGDLYYSGHGSRGELRIHAIGDSLELQRIVRWKGRMRPVQADDVQAAREDLSDRYADLESAMRERLLAPLLHDTRPVADSIPAFVDLHIGRDEAIWVKEYPLPGEAPNWIRFDPEGRAECDLEVPPDLEIYEFGSDYVLGMTRDDLETERVVLYELERTQSTS